jgi:hypothetical protein
MRSRGGHVAFNYPPHHPGTKKQPLLKLGAVQTQTNTMKKSISQTPSIWRNNQFLSKVAISVDIYLILA